jgi:pimeloyl-ACP methyl ester carboxylesterase
VTALDADAVASELIADMQAAGLSNVILVGHSLAGAILPRVAEADPALLRRLIYLTCSAALPGQSFAGLLGKGLHGESEEEVGWPVDPATHTPAQRHRVMFCNDMAPDAADAFLARLGSDIWPMAVLTRTDWCYDHLRSIPASYIVFERDQSLPSDWQRRFAARLHVDSIRAIDAGHQAMLTQPEALAALLMDEAAG